MHIAPVYILIEIKMKTQEDFGYTFTGVTNILTRLPLFDTGASLTYTDLIQIMHPIHM